MLLQSDLLYDALVQFGHEPCRENCELKRFRFRFFKASSTESFLEYADILRREVNAFTPATALNGFLL